MMSIPLPVPPAAGGAADILASFKLEAGQSGFGLAVRSGDVRAEVQTVTPRAGGGFNVTVIFHSIPGGLAPAPPPPPAPVLAYMNHTDLGRGDYKTTHMPPGTDPHLCAKACLADPKCMVWTYHLRVIILS